MSAILSPSTNFLYQADPLTRMVFDRVASESAISGWSLAKMLNQDPDAIATALGALQSQELVNADGTGLEGMYYLTQQGYIARSAVKS
jgi:Mn-dependent DtxR family transcriptional regulator